MNSRRRRRCAGSSAGDTSPAMRSRVQSRGNVHRRSDVASFSCDLPKSATQPERPRACKQSKPPCAPLNTDSSPKMTGTETPDSSLHNTSSARRPPVRNTASNPERFGARESPRLTVPCPARSKARASRKASGNPGFRLHSHKVAPATRTSDNSRGRISACRTRSKAGHDGVRITFIRPGKNPLNLAANRIPPGLGVVRCLWRLRGARCSPISIPVGGSLHQEERHRRV